MSLGDVGEDNVYAIWMREKNQFYRVDGIKRLSDGLQPGEFNAIPSANPNLLTATWRLASEVTAYHLISRKCPARYVYGFRKKT